MAASMEIIIIFLKYCLVPLLGRK